MATETKTPVKIGDVFYASWGYDQTNVDFYEVVGLTPSGKSVRVVRVGKELSEDGRGVVPLPYSSDQAESMTKRLKDYGTPCFNLTSYSNAYLWDGKPKFDTCALGYAGH